MPENESHEYSFVEEMSADFNPLESLDFDDDIDDEDYVPGMLDEGPYGMPDAKNAAKLKLVAFDNAETATERIDTLFNQMPTLERMLIDMLELSRSPIASADMDAQVREMQKYHHSIYSPLTLCSLLERAGAIFKSDADGNSLEDLEQEPLRVEIDGVEYWRVASAPEVFWSISPEGLERYEAYKPAEMIKEVFAAEPEYRRFFLTALRTCATPGGVNLKVVDDLLVDEPELQKPRRYAMYFIDKLEKAGALKWGDTWSATEAGLEFLANLDAQEAAGADAADADPQA